MYFSLAVRLLVNQLHTFEACFETLIWHLSSVVYSKVRVSLLLYVGFLDSLLNTPGVQCNLSSLAGWISVYPNPVGAPIVV